MKQSTGKRTIFCMFVFLVTAAAGIFYHLYLRNFLIEGMQEIESTHKIDEASARILYVTLFLCGLLVILLLSTVIFLLSQRRTAKRIYQIAYQDEVTGLPTKAKHKEDIEKLLASDTNTYVYVSFMIDNFKYINDTFGYLTANKILLTVAEKISTLLNKEEKLSRINSSIYGLLILYDSETGVQRRLLNMFVQAAEHTTQMLGNDHHLTFTAGVYRIQQRDHINRIREYANHAREAAVNIFENTVTFYDEHLHRYRMECEEMEHDMHKAMEEEQFIVYLQPKFSIVTERITGAEALIRWNHPKYGLLLPSRFIPLFEANGFITRVDLYVLRQCCDMLRRQLDCGAKVVRVSVNLSRIHLYDEDLIERLTEIVDSYHVPRQLIEFELTESVLCEEEDMLCDIMRRLKEEGFYLSMDDFGAGYSSLHMLQQLPVDILKLDKGFMNDFDKDGVNSREAKIVTHVISMAKDLDMQVIVEGVENKLQRDFLLATRCDCIQGFYYAHPMPMQAFEKIQNCEIA